MNQLSVLESNCLVTPISFVKQTYSHKSIKSRLGEESLSQLLIQVISKSISLSGIKEKTDSLMMDEIIKMIMLIYHHLTPEEVYKAFELERMRLYDTKTEHYQLFDTGYASEILKKYEDWKLALKQKHNISKATALPQQNLLPSITEAGKKEIMDGAITRCFEEYRSIKLILPPFSHVFEELVKREVIPHPTTNESLKLKQWYFEKRELAKREVQKELEAELKNPFVKKDRNSLLEAITQVDKGESEKIELKLRQIILSGVFQKRIDSGLTIEDWLK